MMKFAIIVATLLIVSLAIPFDKPSPGMRKRLKIMKEHMTPIQPRDDVPTFVYPDTYSIGRIIMVKCLGESGIDGIYCYNLTVRLNRDDQYDNRMIKVAFMTHVPQIHFTLAPTDEREAMWYPLGGPGSTAHNELYCMSDLANEFPQMWQKMDVIFYDQRIMGWSCGMSCAQTMIKYFYAGIFDDDLDTIYDMARAFRRECLTEIATDKVQASTSSECIIGSRANAREQRIAVLPYAGTAHAVRDFEEFRVAAGYGRIHAIGTSYGTAVVQTYCGMFEHVCKSMIIDSTMDTAIDISISARNEVNSRSGYLARTAELCAGEPRCAADACGSDLINCPARIIALFNHALDVTAWPKHIMYPYFDIYTGEYVVIPMEITRHQVELTLSVAAAFNIMRIDLARILLRAAAGDDYAFVHMTTLGVMYLDPRDPYFPLEYLIAADIAQGSVFPIVTGEDYIFRWKAGVPIIRGPEYKMQEYVENYGMDNFNRVLGFSPIVFGSFSPAFADSVPPTFDLQIQNATKVHSPGWHGDYPIFVVHPSHDTNCPTPESESTFARYSSQSPSNTFRITVIDGEHGILDPTIADPGYQPMFDVIDNFLANGELPQSTTMTADTVVKTIWYRPIHPIRSITSDEALHIVDDEFHMMIEWLLEFNVVASCDAGGFVYWQEFNETHELATFVSCAFVDPNVVVDGDALINIATPTIMYDGADMSFESAAVTDFSTGTTTYYKYSNFAGQGPIQTTISAPAAARNKKSVRSVDNAANIRAALELLYAKH